MILPIYTYGSHILKDRAAEIDQMYTGLKDLISNMFDTMRQAEGVGLAAPQIGLSIRIFVVDASSFFDHNSSLIDFKKVFINPKIIERTGEKIPYNEGCLSFPKLYENIYREPCVRISYVDENFVEHNEYYDDIMARIIQHEYDHLEGICFVDRLSVLRRKLISSKLKRIAKGDFSVTYKTKIVM